MKNEIIRKRYLHYLLLMCILLAWTTGSLHASNYVTIATIGNKPHPVDKTQGMQKIVDQIKEFWHKELEQVLPDKPDLIVLPEYCDLYQGLTDEEEDEYFLFRKSQIQDFFASEAKANHCYIAFGMRREMEDGSWRNSCIIVDREGNIAGIYDKNFPTIGDMRGGVKASAQTPLIQCDFGTIGCAICFDLNFDELRRTYVGLKPDIIIFPSMYHGGLVQSYWAYTCRSFFIGSMFSREVPSEIRNPLGEVIASNTNYFDYAVARINLDCQLVHIDYNKDKLFDLKKKYGDAVTITDPDGRLDAILVESKAPNISVVQMLKEFDIELLDDYFDRSRKFRLEPENIILSSSLERPADDLQSANNQLQKEIKPMKRYGNVIKVKPEKLDYYKKLHAEPWPEVIKAINECNVRNFSIYFKDGYLYSYYEYIGTDYNADMEKLSELTKEWLKETDPCQVPVETAKKGEWWAEMEEVFHAD